MINLALKKTINASGGELWQYIDDIIVLAARKVHA